MVDYAIILVVLLAAILEGTHGAAVQEMRRVKPELLNALGRTGPGYYFFRAYQSSPQYRQALISGALLAEVAGSRQLVRLLTVERLLWYAIWVAVAAVAAVVILIN